jgi:hypothetical protein
MTRSNLESRNMERAISSCLYSVPGAKRHRRNAGGPCCHRRALFVGKPMPLIDANNSGKASAHVLSNFSTTAILMPSLAIPLATVRLMSCKTQLRCRAGNSEATGQAVETFAALRSIAGRSDYVFPSPGAEGFMSNNTMLFAMYRIGFHGRATVHGFRAVASTLLNEMGFHPDWIERQLAHDERNKVRAAYSHAQYLPERRRMMQQWADYLDDLAEDGKVIVHHFGRTA